MNTPPTSKPTKAKKPSPTAILQQEITRLHEAQATLNQTIATQQAQLDGYRKSETKREEEVRRLSELLSKARRALKPFRDKTTKWTWPNLELAAVAPLTFGDIQLARDTSQQLDAV